MLVEVGHPVWPPGESARLRFPNVADEPEAFAGDCADQALLFAAVADRLADRIEMTGEGRFGDDPATPHCVQHVILADDALAVPNQIEQQIEDLRPDGDHLGPPGELAPVGVEHAVGEDKLQFDAPWPVLGGAGGPFAEAEPIRSGKSLRAQ